MFIFLSNRSVSARIKRGLLALGSAALLTSCGAGGSVTDLPTLSIQFAPLQAAPLPTNSVSLQAGGVGDDTAAVDVVAEQIALVAFRATFTILYDPLVVEFVGYEPGDFFEQSANNVSYTVPGPAPGTGRLGVTIDKSGAPLGSQGSGVLVRLRFRALAPGLTALAFDNPILADANNNTAQGVSWFGGTIEVF